MSDSTLDRRRLLHLGGAALATTIAGCSGGGGGDGDGGDAPVPSDIEEFLTSDPAAGNYDGGIEDATGQDEVTVDVGAEGNDGNFAFSPPSVRISTGTTVVWEWTGEGGLHNVVAVEDSDFQFTSGDPVESGSYEETFEETGVGLYHCAPHASLGMKGAFEVV